MISGSPKSGSMLISDGDGSFSAGSEPTTTASSASHLKRSSIELVRVRRSELKEITPSLEVQLLFQKHLSEYKKGQVQPSSPFGIGSHALQRSVSTNNGGMDESQQPLHSDSQDDSARESTVEHTNISGNNDSYYIES